MGGRLTGFLSEYLAAVQPHGWAASPGIDFTRLGAISNCQLPITLEVIANDPITNYFTKKVMGNAPNYPLLFGYISN